MLASLEAPVPYLDRAVVEQVASWPAALKLSYGKTKVVLRRLANGLLPGDLANLANRRKHGLRLWSMLTFAWWLEARS